MNIHPKYRVSGPQIVSKDQRAGQICLSIFLGYVGVASVMMWFASRLPAPVMSLLRAWGALVGYAVPSIEQIARLTKFELQAWSASLVVWSLVPLGAVLVSRSDAMWSPDEQRIRRQPIILFFVIAVFILVILAVARYSPPEGNLRGFGVGYRMLARMVESKGVFVLGLGFIAVGVSISIGLLFQAFQLVYRLFFRR